MRTDTRTSLAAWALLLLMVGFLIVECLLNLTPPTSRDALIHHLAVPKIWLAHGGFEETPWADFSYYPMTLQLLYLGALAIGSEVLPKWIHMAFGIATAALVFAYLKRRCGALCGALGAAIFWTTPIIVWLSTSAYIDLGMTFFTTASLVAFFRWRDSDYTRSGWLLLSATCMGMAVGTKYNALLAWAMFNLLLVWVYVRDTRRQAMGLGMGVLFFLITAAVASPWYIKNALLTGNPFYPLFQGFFDMLQAPAAPESATAATPGPRKVGFLEMRRVMYGESLIETLLIPIRMFFQGKDDSYRYFQGVLNPMLILFLPFVFLDRKRHRDVPVWIGFALVFILATYFLTYQQVRYLLPVIPCLAIVAALGIFELNRFMRAPGRPVWLRAAGAGIPLAVAALLAMNIAYLADRYAKIDPMPYLRGMESRDAFLNRSLPHFAAVAFVNRHLPPDASLYTLFLGRRGYYLERPYRNDPSFGRSAVGRLVSRASDPDAFASAAADLGVTHILLRTDLLDRHLRDNFTAEQIGGFVSRIQEQWRLVYADGGYAVWEIVPDDGWRPTVDDRVQTR